MLGVMKSGDRGQADHGWLRSRHTFSFANYWNPKAMGFRNLRVINEDRVRGGAGFPTHPHRDMEIVSYVLGGALEHKDSMGTGSVIRPGEIQRMSAGTGVYHSEFNASDDEEVHFLQIWILPDQGGMEPSYEQVTLPAARFGAFAEIAAPRPAAGGVKLHADARIFSAVLEDGAETVFALPAGRNAWLHLARGRARVSDDATGDDTVHEVELTAGDAAAFEGPARIEFRGLDGDGEQAELLLFELP